MRLIDVDELKAYVNSISTHWLNEWSTLGVLAAIDKQPIIDHVAKVGHWISSGSGFDCCSECRKVFTDGYFTAMGIKPRAQFNYCPNCGARMDGGKNETN